MLMRQRRQVIERPAGFSVEPSLGAAPFVTPLRDLAEHVAREFDKRDPLPFPEHDCTEETVDVHSYEYAEPIRRFCAQCGATV